eukprot:15470934-Alexandrium_andersonii.AAC.1
MLPVRSTAFFGARCEGAAKAPCAVAYAQVNTRTAQQHAVHTSQRGHQITQFAGLGDHLVVLTSAPPKMQHCFRRSLELRGPRNGLNVSTLQGSVLGVRRRFAR